MVFELFSCFRTSAALSDSGFTPPTAPSLIARPSAGENEKYVEQQQQQPVALSDLHSILGSTLGLPLQSSSVVALLPFKKSAYLARTIFSSPGLELLFGGESDDFLQSLVAVHAGARNFFSEVVSQATGSADQPPQPQPRTLELGGPHGWSLTAKLLVVSSSSLTFPALHIEHTFLDTQSLLVQSLARRLLCSKSTAHGMTAVVLLTTEGQVISPLPPLPFSCLPSISSPPWPVAHPASPPHPLLHPHQLILTLPHPHTHRCSPHPQVLTLPHTHTHRCCTAKVVPLSRLAVAAVVTPMTGASGRHCWMESWEWGGAVRIAGSQPSLPWSLVRCMRWWQSCRG